MAGIRDVTKYAGVSPSTVSRALSGVAYVEPEKKEKILQAVKELNYKPNLAAKEFKEKRQWINWTYNSRYYQSLLPRSCKIYGDMCGKRGVFTDFM